MVLHLLDGFFSVEKGRVPPHLKDSLRAKEKHGRDNASHQWGWQPWFVLSWMSWKQFSNSYGTKMQFVVFQNHLFRQYIILEANLNDAYAMHHMGIRTEDALVSGNFQFFLPPEKTGQDES